MLKYPRILSVSCEILKEFEINANITVKDGYSMGMQDIFLVVKSATVYPENKIKIVLVDGMHMTIKV